MNQSYFPNDVTIEKFINFFDFNSHGLVQFYHRNIAYLILCYFFFIGFFIYKYKISRLIKSYSIFALILIIQIVLGIMTLISGLNMYLASAHQICSLLLMLSVINLHFHHIN